MGFNKRSHHSNLLHAVRIDKVETSVIRGILSLWYRIYQVDNPARVLSNAMLCDYINSRHLIPGTLIHRVVEAGFSPIKCLSIKQQFTAHRANNIHDGIVDSLRHLASYNLVSSKLLRTELYAQYCGFHAFTNIVVYWLCCCFYHVMLILFIYCTCISPILGFLMK